MMISPKKLLKMARKWQRIAAIRRRRIVLPRTSGITNSTKVEKGHFSVYTTDSKRHVFPIQYLDTYIFRELLVLSEEEFGLPGNGPIRFPCDSVFMDYAASIISRQPTKDMEKALLTSIESSRCSLHCSRLQESSQQLITCVF